MSIEKLIDETRVLYGDARAAADAAHEVSADVLAVARRVNLATTYAAAERWRPTLAAALEVLNEALTDLMAIEDELDLITADLNRVAGLDNPFAADARIRVAATADLIEIAGDRCVEHGNLAELAAQRVKDFHEFEKLTAATGMAIAHGDVAAFDRDIGRLTELAAELSTLDTEATLDLLNYQRATLDPEEGN